MTKQGKYFFNLINFLNLIYNEKSRESPKNFLPKKRIFFILLYGRKIWYNYPKRKILLYDKIGHSFNFYFLKYYKKKP